MRHALLVCLALFVAAPALAQAPPPKDAKALAGYWLRMPQNAKLSYMVGAVTGLQAVCDTQPVCQGRPDPRIDKVLGAMDTLVADEANQSLPMMAVAAAALSLALDEDPTPPLRIGRAMVGELTPLDLEQQAGDTRQAAPATQPSKAAKAQNHRKGGQ